MFDQIHFDRIQLSGNALSQVSHSGEKLSAEEEERLRQLQYTVTDPRHTEFFLDGYTDGISLFPVSETAMKHYCYIQSFSIMTSGPKYYTRRSLADSCMILYTYEGAGILEYEGKTYRLRKGNGFLIDCRKEHYYKTDGTSWKHLDLHVNGPMVPPLYEEYQKNGSAVFYEEPGGPLQNHLEQLAALCDAARPYRDLQIAEVLYSILIHILTLSAPHGDGTSSVAENLQYLIRYMENHYTENLTLDFLSHFSGISKYYLSREFHRYTGFPPNEYLIRLRMERARILLADTDWPVQKVAESVGIPNAQHFSKLFHRVCNVTPSKYRRSCGRQDTP